MIVDCAVILIEQLLHAIASRCLESRQGWDRFKVIGDRYDAVDLSQFYDLRSGTAKGAAVSG
jgi:hypothetical protein